MKNGDANPLANINVNSISGGDDNGTNNPPTPSNPTGGGNNDNPPTPPDPAGGNPNPPTPPTPPDPAKPNPKGADGGNPPNPNDGDGNNDDDDQVALYEDADGNFADKDGNVIIKKEDVKRDADGNVILPDSDTSDGVIGVVQTGIRNALGIEIVDEAGKPVVYEDTDEGVVQFVADAIRAGVDDERASLFETFPVVGRLLKHLQAGKPPESFFSNAVPKWSNFQLPGADVKDDSAMAARKNVVLENFKRTLGYDTATAEERPGILARAQQLTGVIEDGGKLTEESAAALKDLQKYEDATTKAADAANQAAIDAENTRINNYWKSVNTAINSGKIGNLNIPKTEQQAFLDYVSKDVTGKGQTQEMLDQAGEEVGTALQLAYMRFKKFNVTDLAKVYALEQKVTNLSQRKAKYKLATTSNDTVKPQNTAANLQNIKLSKLLGD